MAALRFGDAAECGAITLDKLEAMTAVRSIGRDMIPFPGDTPAETLAAIIADEAVIGMINQTITLSVCRQISTKWF